MLNGMNLKFQIGYADFSFITIFADAENHLSALGKNKSMLPSGFPDSILISFE